MLAICSFRLLMMNPALCRAIGTIKPWIGQIGLWPNRYLDSLHRGWDELSCILYSDPSTNDGPQTFVDLHMSDVYTYSCSVVMHVDPELHLIQASSLLTSCTTTIPEHSSLVKISANPSKCKASMHTYKHAMPLITYHPSECTHLKPSLQLWPWI